MNGGATPLAYWAHTESIFSCWLCFQYAPSRPKESPSRGCATPSAYWAHMEASFSLRTHKCRLGGPYYEMSTMRLRVGTNEATLVKWNAFIVFSSMQVCKCIGKMSSVPSMGLARGS